MLIKSVAALVAATLEEISSTMVFSGKILTVSEICYDLVLEM